MYMAPKRAMPLGHDERGREESKRRLEKRVQVCGLDWAGLGEYFRFLFSELWETTQLSYMMGFTL